MLLEPVPHFILDSSERIEYLSPIKCNEPDKDKGDSNSAKYQSFRTSLSKSENRLSQDSIKKFDYFLTPQKDQGSLVIGQL